MASNQQIVILGSGLAGLSAAYHCPAQCHVYEKHDTIGGLTRSQRIDGFTFDYAPHILFPTDKYISQLIIELLGDNRNILQREAYIYHKKHNTYTKFPFQAHLFGLPDEIVTQCLNDLISALKNTGKTVPKNYREWLYLKFGKNICDQLLIPYSKKIWTINPEELNCDWIVERVPEPDFISILEGALWDVDKKTGFNNEFWYPKKGGIEALPNSLAKNIKNIHLNMRANKISTKKKQVEFNESTIINYDKLVSSLPLPALVNLFENAPSEVINASKKLEHNSVICINLGIDRENISPHHWVYFYESEFLFHRISYPMNFSPNTVPDKKSSICCEISYSKNRPLPISGKEKIIAQTITDLKKANILKDTDKILVNDILSIHYAYVIYDFNHRKSVDTIHAFLKDNDIFPCGRYGEWEYLNMDHSLLSGKNVMDALSKD